MSTSALPVPAPRYRGLSAPRTVRLLTAACGALAVVGVLCLSAVPSSTLWLAVWQVLGGLGFAVSARQVLRSGRSNATGGWFLAAAVLLLLSVPLQAVGLDPGSTVATTWAFAVAVPLGVLHVVRPLRGHAFLRTVDGWTAVLGSTCAVAVAAGWAPLVVAAGLSVAATTVGAGWVQFEVTAGDERRQVLWVILGVCSCFTSAAVFGFVSADALAPARDLVLALALAPVSLLLPLMVSVAVLAPRRVDVRLVISRTTVVVVMLTLTLAVFTGAESAVSALTGRQLVAPGRALLAATIAAGFHPALVRVSAAVEEMLFGGRTDAMGTLTLLTTELSSGSPPQEWLDTLRVALGVPSVVLSEKGRVLAASPARDSGLGDPENDRTEGSTADSTLTARTEKEALMVAAEHVGDLVVGIPDEQLRLTPATRLVLSLLAVPLAQALHAIRLGDQLRASRGQVVAALEEERRRVRRDLHDGLGPTLTGIAYTAEAAANLVVSDGARSRELLQELRVDAADAIAEVRRIVYGLRPRALDELGLVAAVRQRLQHGRTADGRLVELEVVAPEVMPELPAAVEVAAYRIAVEALTNVARHAGVTAARVVFAVSGEQWLTVTVMDLGSRPEPWTPGVGLSSMRERAEEVGGTLTVEHGPAGARVTASLPLDDPTET